MVIGFKAHSVYLLTYKTECSLGNCRRGLLAIRGLFGFGAIGCYFWAIQLLPIQDAMVLTFLAPLWVALLGPIFIKEKPSK